MPWTEYVTAVPAASPTILQDIVGELVLLPDSEQSPGAVNDNAGPAVAQSAVSTPSSRSPGPLFCTTSSHRDVSPTPIGFVKTCTSSDTSARLSSRIVRSNLKIAYAPNRSVALISTSYGRDLASPFFGMPDNTPLIGSMASEPLLGRPLALKTSTSSGSGSTKLSASASSKMAPSAAS